MKSGSRVKLMAAFLVCKVTQQILWRKSRIRDGSLLFYFYEGSPLFCVYEAEKKQRRSRENAGA